MRRVKQSIDIESILFDYDMNHIVSFEKLITEIKQYIKDNDIVVITDFISLHFCADRGIIRVNMWVDKKLTRTDYKIKHKTILPFYIDVELITDLHSKLIHHSEKHNSITIDNSIRQSVIYDEYI